MSDATMPVAHQFDDAAQQKSAATLGMWLFLLNEIMFFGGLFLTYAVYRYLYPDAFAAGSHHLNAVFGTINTAVLILSSLCMALAVRFAQTTQRKKLTLMILATMTLAMIFIVIKGFEYYHDYELHLIPGKDFRFTQPLQKRAQLFFSIYFAMTGLHALHMIIGIAIMACLLIPSWRGKYTAAYHNPIEMTGLYWHFVDVIWVFLFPLFYLIDPKF
jgi:cytochrome c oxidase subunit 3